jgi:hypothetical protein
LTSPWEHPPLHDCAACSRKRETALEAEVAELEDDRLAGVKREVALRAEVERLTALVAAQEARAQRVEAVLRGVRHAIDEGGNCWCAYFRVVHTPPDDAIPLRDGHTEECWTARAALSQPAATGEGT